MQEIERDDVVELAAQTQCAVCKTPYGREGIQVMGQRGDSWMIAVTCPNCEAEGLMIATVDKEAEHHLSIGREADPKPKIMFDVTYDEWFAFQKRPPISKDDVLDMHLFLKDFEGDFQRLFTEDTTDTEDKMK